MRNDDAVLLPEDDPGAVQSASPGSHRPRSRHRSLRVRTSPAGQVSVPTMTRSGKKAWSRAQRDSP
ncbi:hypothetical protein SLI_7299 [Streptomyces lividans 1326]|uniref:Uncharacterized protein n=1 Tax=Streptomyces lividans 1326 TaxID=1200984 RepID=A0A7U9HEM2_STRLI|nr:hypothetical protein SLI_7299 [Streptomyces lividans 1326]